MKRVVGTVYLVGAGPGAPDLLTLRAADILRRADIVFHDALIAPEVLALAVRAERVAVGKRCGRHSTAQRFINKRLVDAARKYRTVVRLKGGDPMLFGRAQEEIAALTSEDIRYEVVPGVTAALAAGAEAGISLTRRGVARSVAFVTAQVGQGEPASNWAEVAAVADTAVIYMGAEQAAAVTAALIAAGARHDLPVLVVENATLPQARHLAFRLRDLSRLPLYGLTGPTVIMLGTVFEAAAAALANAGSLPDCKTA